MLGVFLQLSACLLLSLPGLFVVPVTGLEHCCPERIRSMKNVEYKRVSGLWYLVGRDDVGIVDNKLWNGQLNLTVSQRDRAVKVPVWFNSPRGCCLLAIDLFGRTTGGGCEGRRYEWGVSLDEQPARFKHKLVGMTHYSLLNILDTDYDNHLVLAHCRSKAIGMALFCSSFNLFLLKRQVPPLSENAARIFNTLTTRARLREACSGQVQLVSTQNNDPVCQYSSVNFRTPEWYDINHL